MKCYVIAPREIVLMIANELEHISQGQSPMIIVLNLTHDKKNHSKISVPNNPQWTGWLEQARMKVECELTEGKNFGSN